MNNLYVLQRVRSLVVTKCELKKYTECLTYITFLKIHILQYFNNFVPLFPMDKILENEILLE